MGEHIRITLTPEQYLEIDARIRATSDRRVADRLRIVLYKAQNYFHQHILARLQIKSLNTVTNTLHVYVHHSLEAICTYHYVGSEPCLDEAQRLRLVFELKTHIYHTAQQVIVWVKTNCAVEYTVSGMHKLLRRLGFKYKKGRLMPSKADPEKRRQFVNAYRQLCAELGPDDRIYFSDAAHFVHNAEAAYCWSERGHPHLILTNTGRERYNVIGVYYVQTQEFLFIQTPENINRNTVIDLLTRLQARHPQPAQVYVILVMPVTNTPKTSPAIVKSPWCSWSFCPPIRLISMRLNVCGSWLAKPCSKITITLPLLSSRRRSENSLTTWSSTPRNFALW